MDLNVIPAHPRIGLVIANVHSTNTLHANIDGT